MGRATKLADLRGYKISVHLAVSACTVASSLIIFRRAKVVGSVGSFAVIQQDHPIVLGIVRGVSLAAILDCAENNPILHTIRVWGPRNIVALLEIPDPKQHLPNSNLADSPCGICQSSFSHPRICETLRQLRDDETFIQRTQHARVYYLDEVAPDLLGRDES